MNERERLLLALPAVVAAEVRRNREALKGERGDRGEKGDRGADGRDGKDGKDGREGKPGRDGAQGAAGSPGMDGRSGKDIIRAYELDERKLREFFDLWIAERPDTLSSGKINFFGGTAAGPIGPAGAPGAPGVGVPAGGSAGQVLAKASGTDYDTVFSTMAAAAAWGSITGTISTQTDLQDALNAKQDATTFAAVAFSGQYGDLSGRPALGTVSSTDASTWALAASSYVYQAQLGTAASTNAANYASSTHQHDASQVTSGIFSSSRLATNGSANASSFLAGNQTWSQFAGVATSGAYGSLTGTPTLGTVASTAASTWAMVSTYVYQSQIGTAASTAASTWAFATHKHDAVDVTSGVFALSRIASTGTPTINTFLAGNTSWVAYNGIATSGAYASLSGTPTLGTVASTAASTWSLASLTTTFAGATVNLGLNTYSTAVSLSLAAGTYLVQAQALVGQDVATSTRFTAKLTDGTNNYASGQEPIPAATSTYASIILAAMIKLGATSTVSLQCAGDITGGKIRAQAWQNAAGSTATYMIAQKIAN